MPITPFLDGHKFDPETKYVLGVAFEMVCIALRIGDCDDYVKQAIANKVIDLATAGERNPDLLCEQPRPRRCCALSAQRVAVPMSTLYWTCPNDVTRLAPGRPRTSRGLRRNCVYARVAYASQASSARICTPIKA